MGRGKRLWLSVGVAAVAAVAAAGASAARRVGRHWPLRRNVTRPRSAASGSCSRATARQLVEQLPPHQRLACWPNPLRQLLCGSVHGSRQRRDGDTHFRRALTCWVSQRWAVFRSSSRATGSSCWIGLYAFIFPLSRRRRRHPGKRHPSFAQATHAASRAVGLSRASGGGTESASCRRLEPGHEGRPRAERLLFAESSTSAAGCSTRASRRRCPLSEPDRRRRR